MAKKFFLKILLPTVVILIIGLLFYEGLHINWSHFFSPGKLSIAHAKLDLSGDCQACHTKGKQLDIGKCLACHEKIKEKKELGRGLHSKASGTCLHCHSEHHGREYNVAYFDLKNFDHSITGWKLEGLHNDLKCETCHKKDTYLLDKTKCIDCHEDIHEGENGDDCGECHSQHTFKME